MAALYAGEGVSGWPFAVDGWRWIVFVVRIAGHEWDLCD